MAGRARIAEVLDFLGIQDREFLDALRREGLFEAETVEAAEADELRVATCLVRELGVNPAGVEVILHLRRRLLTLQGRVETELRALLAELEEEGRRGG